MEAEANGSCGRRPGQPTRSSLGMRKKCSLGLWPLPPNRILRVAAARKDVEPEDAASSAACRGTGRIPVAVQLGSLSQPQEGRRLAYAVRHARDALLPRTQLAALLSGNSSRPSSPDPARRAPLQVGHRLRRAGESGDTEVEEDAV
jgi:hypothetical protein